jgi:nucleoside-triphosphatase THEP1
MELKKVSIENKQLEMVDVVVINTIEVEVVKPPLQPLLQRALNSNTLLLKVVHKRLKPLKTLSEYKIIEDDSFIILFFI